LGEILKIIKHIGWKLRLGILLVLLSALLYTIQFLIFHKPNTELFYLGIDLAFLPIEVLLVVLVIETAISEREKSILLEKMNMVIGAFFSEVGTNLLDTIIKFDPDNQKIRENLLISRYWSGEDFLDAEKKIKNFHYRLDINGQNPLAIKFLQDSKTFLVNKRKFLLALLENPNLLEHETFTELLRAVFHLMDELDHREDLTQLPRADYLHLSSDTARAYSLLIQEWIKYMQHLMNNYPYLFSLAVRMSPFDPDAKVEISDD
jgi:hypothetical protein